MITACTYGEYDPTEGNCVTTGEIMNMTAKQVQNPILPVLFSVSADKTVRFSKGNLQYLGKGDGTKTPQ